MNKAQMSRVIRLARFLHVACTVSLIAMLAFFVILLVQGEAGAEALRQSYSGYQMPDVLSGMTVITVRLIQSISFVLTLYILWQMRKLFSLYKRGETLSARCAALILRCGQTLIAVGLIGFISNTLIILLLTWGNSDGNRTLAIQFSAGDAGFFLGGGLIVVIGWVMREAANIAAENEAFV